MIRRISAGLLTTLGAAGLFGCGTSAYPSTLRVVVEDPSGVLAPGPVRVAVFDPALGDTRDWALKSLGAASPGDPLVATVSSVETRLGGGGSPAKEVRAGIYLPDYRELGWYELKLRPANGGETSVEARFIAWDGYAPGAASVPPLQARVKSDASGKTWDLAVTITLGRDRPDEGRAVIVNDAVTLDLVKAAAAGNLDEVKRLLLKGGQINGGDADGRTAIVAATYASQLEVARYLAQWGADVNLKDAAGVSAFLAATSEAGPDDLLLVVMLNAKAKLADTDDQGNTGLHRATRRGYAAIARRLLTNGVSVDAVNGAGRTALHEALLAATCTDGHVEVVDLLVKAGADFARPTPDGRRPLDLARASPCPEVVTVLETAGAR